LRTHRWAHRPEPDPDAPVVNPFATRTIAVRYASARPDLHHHVTPILVDLVPRPRRALDLGCGTGLSTAALRGFANTVVGVDVSEDMLAARTDLASLYVLAAAERLPFVDGSFDLVTIASAIHWFDPEAIAEVARVLTAAGWLVVYDVWFRAEMADVPEFGEWAQGEGLSRYRPVAKHEYDERILALVGFKRAWETELRREVEMSQEALVEYLMTHSERIKAIREGLETESGQRRFLMNGIDPFYTDARTRMMAFGIQIEAFRR
jgi:ubiquinone/menaquinone biosynthesis C-methylase UbiE